VKEASNHNQTVFPSTYRNNTASGSTEVKVDEQIKISAARTGREGQESRYEAYRRGPRQEEIRIHEEDRTRRPVRREEDIRIHEELRYNPRDSRDTRIEIEREQ